MSAARKYKIIVLGLIVALYIIPLGVRPMFVPDESRYAEVAREMIATGDWVSPHLDGLRYFEKPVLGYWATAFSIMLFGENNFAIRLPSALSVALTAFFIFTMVEKATKKEKEISAFLAALVFLTCLEVYAVGTFCVLDSLLACFLTGAMAFFYQAAESIPGSRQEKRYLLLSGVFCGFAFLTKGFLAFAVPVLSIVPYLLIQRRYRDLGRMAWLPIITAVLVALPWSILIHLREPKFWNFFFWNEHIRRFLAKDAQHSESFWFFFVSAPPMFLPWIFLVPASVTGLFSKTKAGNPIKNESFPLVGFCVCWFVFPFLFFSASSGKLLTYILPCFPPFAILMTIGLKKALDQGHKRCFQFGAMGAATLYGVLFSAIVGLMIYKHFFDFDIPLLQNKDWKWLVAANGLLVMVLFFIASIRDGKPIRKILFFGLAPMPFLFLANFTMPDLTLEKKAPDLLLQRHLQDVTQNSILLSGDETVPNVCWQFKREDVSIIGSPGELRFGVQFEDSRGKHVDLLQASALIEQNPGKSVLITTVKDYESWKNSLPTPALLDNSGAKGYVFVKF